MNIPTLDNGARKRFNPQAYPASVRDRVQIDYAGKLSADERSWLASFNEAEYGHNPDCLEFITGDPVSDCERRRLRRELKRYERDSLTMAPRQSLDLYFLYQEADTRSNEDKLIEIIDRSMEIERFAIRYLKRLIHSKPWTTHDYEKEFYVETCEVSRPSV